MKPLSSWVALLGTCAFLLFACVGQTKEDELPPAPEERPILQFAPRADVDDTNVKEYSRDGTRVRLATPRTFDFEYVVPATDRFGSPALRFEVCELQKHVFEAWTASLVGRELAILVDGEIVAMPRVVSALPGEGIIEFGAMRKTKADVKLLADRIRSQAERKQGE